MTYFMNLIHLVYNFLWGDLVTLPLPGGSSLGLSLLVLLLAPAGIYFTIRTRDFPSDYFRKCSGSPSKSAVRSTKTGSRGFRP